jgi:hypothetical protein
MANHHVLLFSKSPKRPEDRPDVWLDNQTQTPSNRPKIAAAMGMGAFWL